MSHENYSRSDAAEGGSDRSFGLVLAGVFILVALSPLFSGGSIRSWALFAGGLFLLATIMKPSLLSGLNRLWTAFGQLLHKIVSPILLAIIFFAVISPFAVVMRLFRKDALGLAAEPAADSYWQKREAEPQSMTHQF